MAQCALRTQSVQPAVKKESRHYCSVAQMLRHFESMVTWYLFNSLFRLVIKSSALITGSLCYWKLCIAGFLWGSPVDFVLNSSPPGQNGHHFTHNTFKRILTNEKHLILIHISLTFVPEGPIDNKAALVQVMAWRCPAPSHYLNECGLITWTNADSALGQCNGLALSSAKPLPEPMRTQFTDA